MIEQKFRIVTVDGTFEEFYPWDLEGVKRVMEEESPEPGYVLSVEPLAIVSVPLGLLRRDQ